LAFASACHISIASSTDLPVFASPPVSSVVKPILIGSAARAAAPGKASVRKAAPNAVQG